MADCIFCKIVKKEMPKEFKFEDKNIVAFDDINPKADVHILLVPRKHVNSFEDLSDEDGGVLLSIKNGIQTIARDKGLIGRGYKIQVFAGGAQTVDHLHFHLLGPVGLRV